MQVLVEKAVAVFLADLLGPAYFLEVKRPVKVALHVFDNPGNLAARKLLLQLDVQPDTEREAEAGEGEGERRPADADALASRFREALGGQRASGDDERARRLRRWLRRIGKRS